MADYGTNPPTTTLLSALATPNLCPARSPSLDRTSTTSQQYKPRIKPPRAIRRFLQALFTDPAVIEYVFATAKPESPADLQLAESELILQGWLPLLHPAQVRKIWNALEALPHERTPLLADSESSSCSESGRYRSPPPPPAPHTSFSDAPQRPIHRLGSFSQIWPSKHDRSTFMVETSHFFSPGLLWIDVSGEPESTRPASWETDYSEYLEELASLYHLHPASINDILTPGELPKTEFTDGVTFCLMRYCVEQELDADVDDISEVSYKLVVIITAHPETPNVDVVIALHLHPLRTDPRSEAFEGYYEMQSANYLEREPEMTKDHLVNILFDDVLDTYEIAINRLRILVDDYEKHLTRWTHSDLTTQLYAVRRRVSVYKRLLQMTQQSIQKYVKHVYRHSGHDPFAEDLRDTVKSLLFSIDDLSECTTEMLNLHISLVSHRSNHLLYVLTIITVMFTPMTFIGTVYGMNFDNMPELHLANGYYICLGGMLCAVLTTLFCLRWNGFICTVEGVEKEKV